MKLFAVLALAFGGAPVEFAEVQRLSLAGEHEAARAAGTELRASPGFITASEVSRADALFAIGVAEHRADAPHTALPAFLEARDLAGPGQRRLDAMYDIGTILLEQAEAVRGTIPEIADASGVAPMPGAPQDEEGPDPLETARAGYLGARAALLDRVRTAHADADTRANLELAVRRLRELDEIEQERERQQQEQEQQEEQQDDQQESSEDSESQPSEDDSEQEQQDQEDQESEDSGEQEQEEPEEQPPEDENEGEENEDSEGEAEEQPQPEEGEEEFMSREEIQRLMDRLREIEEQARAVQAMLRKRERVPVEKDW